MTDDSNWNLPEDYSVSVGPSGTTTLFWEDDCRVWVFPPGCPRHRIEIWIEAYELGRQRGHTAGEALGRQSLAHELRLLLQIPPVPKVPTE